MTEHPIFKNPKQYLRFREGSGIYRFFKRRFEWRSIELCLKGIDDISSVCDCPSGPGRLFEYWKKKGYKITAVDFSDDMVKASKEELDRYRSEGKAYFQNAFKLDKSNIERTDLVACVRFIYYFDKETRVNLLKKLAQFSRKYILVQYKTSETIRGRKNIKKNSNKYHHKYTGIVNELNNAGLDCIKIVPKGESSDRVYVLAQKKESYRTGLDKQTRIYKPIKFHLKAVAAVLVFAVLIGSLQTMISDPHERAIEGIVSKYQDGNDFFYVYPHPETEDLQNSSRVSVINNLPLKINGILKNRKSNDYFFIISSSQFNLFKKKSPIKNLNMAGNFVVENDRFLLLTTEKNNSRKIL